MTRSLDPFVFLFVGIASALASTALGFISRSRVQGVLAAAAVQVLFRVVEFWTGKYAGHWSELFLAYSVFSVLIAVPFASFGHLLGQRFSRHY